MSEIPTRNENNVTNNSMPISKKKQKQKPQAQVIKPTLKYSDLPQIKMIDIGANLTAGCWNGHYQGRSKKHDNDLLHVLVRGINTGVYHNMITGCDLKGTHDALKLVKQYPGVLTTTIGFHPTHTHLLAEAEQKGKLEEVINDMNNIATQGMLDGSICAIGECGLDFNIDRLKFSDEQTQRKYFPLHLKLATETGLPMFLHNRESNDAMMEALLDWQKQIVVRKSQGDYPSTLGHCVIHSYDGGVEFMDAVLALTDITVYIGLNGCSLRTEEGLAVARSVPLDRLMVETDAPYCAIKRTHPSYPYVDTHWPVKKNDKYQLCLESILPSRIDSAPSSVKASLVALSKLVDEAGPQETTPEDKRELPILVDSRSEPCQTLQVLEIIAKLKNENISLVANHAFENTMKCFFPSQ